MKISVLNTGLASAFENMELDRQILEHLDPDESPILHLYDWKQPSLTYGHFAKVESLLDLEGVKKHQIDHARRVTGGGVTLHFTDLAFSFFMPRNHPLFSDNVLENYAWVNEKVAQALKPFLLKNDIEFYTSCKCSEERERFFFCMAKPTRYDLIIEGKKIGGAAQRKTQRGFLHHGTISLIPPNPNILKDILVDKKEVYEAILSNSFTILDKQASEGQLKELRHTLSEALTTTFLRS
jgi:lipoate-protein ligase A